MILVKNATIFPGLQCPAGKIEALEDELGIYRVHDRVAGNGVGDQREIGLQLLPGAESCFGLMQYPGQVVHADGQVINGSGWLDCKHGGGHFYHQDSGGHRYDGSGRPHRRRDICGKQRQARIRLAIPVRIPIMVRFDTESPR